MMYESPITIIQGELQTTMEKECMKVVQAYGFDVNKEELAKALSYDRIQYSKGYSDGYDKAIDDFVCRLRSRIIMARRVDEKLAYVDECDIDEIVKELKDGDV